MPVDYLVSKHSIVSRLALLFTCFDLEKGFIIAQTSTFDFITMCYHYLGHAQPGFFVFFAQDECFPGWLILTPS